MKVSIAKLAGTGVLDYLTQQVADDYYTAERGEAPGRWWGSGTALLDLAGTVRPFQLARVLDACDPRTGDPLLSEHVRQRPDRVTGFDVTFSVPKEVSILAGICADVEIDGQRVGTVVETTIGEAITVGLEYLSTRLQVRRGHAGERRLDAAPVVARFAHRTSRDGDPQWHQHCVVAAVARGTDGRWSQLDFHGLYRDAHAAASLAGARLRQRLTERLGVGWEWPADGGLPRLGHIDPALTRTFSKRRARIEAYLDDRQALDVDLNTVADATRAQRATLNTRGRKGLIDYAELRERWHREANALDWQAEHIVAQVTRRLERHWRTTAVDLIEALETAAGPDGLCAMAASFDRTDVIRWLCDRTTLEWHHTVALAEAFCETAVHRLATPGPARYTTQTQRDLEQRCVDLARTGRHAAHACSPAAIATVLDHNHGLSAEQEDAARALAASDDLVTVLVGPAGTGKTRLAAALREIAEHDGISIGGAALARRAARNLHDASGIGSTSVDAWCKRITTQGPGCLPGVLVLDEANMVDTRSLVTLATAAQRAGTRIVAMGDPEQLGAVGAGGGFLAWYRHLPVVELSAVRRHTRPEQLAALRLWRDGHTDEALATFDGLGWITHHHDRDHALAACVNHWDHDRGKGSTIMLAVTRADVADLNHHARELRRERAELRGPDHVYGNRAFAVGDRVRARRNTSSIDNGETGIITGIDLRRRITVALDERVQPRDVVIEPAYAEQYLEHAYAATITLTEGLTYDYAHVLGGDALAKEAAYVALTRNRLECRLHDWQHDDDESHLAIHTERQALGERLQRARAEHLAIDNDPVIGGREAATFEARVDIWRESIAILDHGEPIPDAWRAPLEHLRQDLNGRRLRPLSRERALAGDLTARLYASPAEPHAAGTDTIRRVLERGRDLVADAHVDVDTERSRATLNRALELARATELPHHDVGRSHDTVAAIEQRTNVVPAPRVDHGIDLGR